MNKFGAVTLGCGSAALIPLLVLTNRKTRNPPSNHLFHNAGFMESIV
jgi:hypothetical protein